MPRRTSSLVWFAGRRNPRLAVVPVRVLAAAAAVPIVARRLVSRPARARALARLARLAARGPAPRSRTAPIRERHRGAAAAHTVAVVAPAAAHLLTYGKRQGRETARNSLGGASRTPVAEGGGALWKARRSISPREENGEKTQCGQCATRSQRPWMRAAGRNSGRTRAISPGTCRGSLWFARIPTLAA